MFVNDYSDLYRNQWGGQGMFPGNQMPLMHHWGTMPYNNYNTGWQVPTYQTGWNIPSYGFTGQHPYQYNTGTQNTGYLQGQTYPQQMTSHQLTGMNTGLGYQTNPFTNNFMGQCYTPFAGGYNNFPFFGYR